MLSKEEIISKAYEYIKYEDNQLFKNEIEELIKVNNYEELYDRFYVDLEFGTGGLRGIIGGGYNRMNPLTVKRATQGLANYINKSVGKGNGSAVIAYDSRRFSDVFALESAKVLCANEIKCYLFSSLRPTPELSFAVRELKTTAGIVITASHNPPEYNGYKVYWSDGAQVVSPTDKEIIEEVRKSPLKALCIEKEEAISKGLLKIIDKEIDDSFIEMVKNCTLRKNLFQKIPKDFKVVYTPLHGSGAMPVIRALTELGVNIITVPEQKEADGNFPTVKYPNPEEASALKMAIELAEKENADLVIATDPDADRLGIAVKDKDEFKLINGNQLGALLEEYILSTRKELNTLPQNPVIIKTIVTTELQRKIANYYGVECIDTLTGFKYIGEKIREFEQQKNYSYVFGGEESYGYLVNTSVRDKDAISAAVVTVEMTLFNYMQNKTLYDKLREIWQQFGYFEETQISKKFEGESGFKNMNTLIEKLRLSPPTYFGGFKVLKVKDYQKGITTFLPEKTTQKDIFLPPSNVLQFILEDNSIISVRPSGTEPKIKFYISSQSGKTNSLESAIVEVKRKIEIFKEEINKIIKGV